MGKINNKGFLLYELIVSFVVIGGIFFVLMSTTFAMKDKNSATEIENKMIIGQTKIINAINQDLINYELVSLNYCQSNDFDCLQFSFKNGINKKLEIIRDDLLIKYDDMGSKFPNETFFGKDGIVMNHENVDGEDGINNAILRLTIRLENEQLKDYYDIKVIYQYNQDDLQIEEVRMREE